jgi:hypothetical protein
MEDFRRKSILGHGVPPDDKGVSVSAVVDLAKEDTFFNELADLLNIEKLSGEFIEIPGAKTVVNALTQENRRFVKFDFESDYQDLEFFYGDDSHFYISFINIKDERIKKLVGGQEFTCRTEYSSKSDFFKNTFAMQAFASDLVRKGHSDFVKQTLDSVKELLKRGSHRYTYRILKDSDGIFYLRAIVSSRYNDYNDNITIMLGLVALHEEMKKSKQSFFVKKFEYNESFVRVSFAKKESRTIEGIGKMKYVVEVTNDEIKREALKFASAITIIYGENKEDEHELYIKPSNLKSKILTISHGSTPETAIQRLGNLENYTDKEEEAYKDIIRIAEVKDPNTVRHLIYSRIKNTNKAEISINKNAILSELNTTVNNLHQLFVALNKVEHLTQDIEGKEYLRYLFYDALVYRKLRKEERNDDEENY